MALRLSQLPPGICRRTIITEIIHQVLGNIIRSFNLHDTYVDYADPWMGILAAAAFVVQAIYHRTKQKIPVQLVLAKT